jgi:hypothetical protein
MICDWHRNHLWKPSHYQLRNHQCNTISQLMLKSSAYMIYDWRINRQYTPSYLKCFSVLSCKIHQHNLLINAHHTGYHFHPMSYPSKDHVRSLHCFPFFPLVGHCCPLAPNLHMKFVIFITITCYKYTFIHLVHNHAISSITTEFGHQHNMVSVFSSNMHFKVQW